MFKKIIRYYSYFLDLCKYSRMPDAEPIKRSDLNPQIHDRTKTTGIDPHYFFANGWAMRRIYASNPKLHVDVGSQVILVNLLGAVVPVIFLDYRPLQASLTGLKCVAGNILCLPFADKSINSLSCLHVIEHIGLGRYGDTLDPNGTRKAARELSRVLAPGGNLFFAAPVGKTSLCFNAHRILLPEALRELFNELDLVEFSGVHDDGRFVECVGLTEFTNSRYACGFYWFRRSPCLRYMASGHSYL